MLVLLFPEKHRPKINLPLIVQKQVINSNHLFCSRAAPKLLTCFKLTLKLVNYSQVLKPTVGVIPNFQITVMRVMDGEERIPPPLHFYYRRLMYFGNFPQFPLYYEFVSQSKGVRNDSSNVSMLRPFLDLMEWKNCPIILFLCKTGLRLSTTSPDGNK